MPFGPAGYPLRSKDPKDALNTIPETVPANMQIQKCGLCDANYKYSYANEQHGHAMYECVFVL